MLYTLLFMSVLFKASASRISGDGSTTADYGGDAHYTCTLDKPTGVLQVTWQRLFKGDSIENMATYSDRFGQQVNEPFKGKVAFTEASLRSTSITVKNVTWADESCYICSFNAYPDGSKSWQRCLKVQGISEVETQIDANADADADANADVAFSCRATGKPAPTIDWDVSAGAVLVDRSETTTAPRRDGTFTSRRNVTLRLPPVWNGHVDCLVNNDRTTGRQRRRIAYSQMKESNTDKGQTSLPQIILPIILIVAFLSTVAVVASIRINRKRANGGTETVL